MSDSMKERAEKVWKQLFFIEEHDKPILEKALIETRNQALEDAAGLCSDFTTQPQCNDPAHDVRWCARCSSMDDAAAILEDKIRALKSDGGGK